MNRVCHLTSVHGPEDVRIFVKECCSLAAAGYETHIVVPTATSYQKEGVLIHAVPRTEGGRLRRMLMTAWRTYRMAKALEANVYHIHDPELLPYALLLEAQGSRVVYDAHEDVPRDLELKPWLYPYLRRPLSILFERFENACARRLSAVVAATPHIAERFQKVNPDSIVVSNFPRGGELQTDRSGNVPFAAEVRPYVCYVGSINSSRGIREMVAAIAKTDSQLLLAGAFSSEGERREMECQPGWKQVNMLGYIDRPTLAQTLQRCFAGLVVLHPESTYIISQPIKMFEYMSVGIPVIASDFPLWRDLIMQVGCGILVDPFDVDAIAAAITTLASDRESARAMGERGQQAVVERFNWEREEPKLLELYRKLLNKSNS